MTGKLRIGGTFGNNVLALRGSLLTDSTLHVVEKRYGPRISREAQRLLDRMAAAKE
jgi:hypothetical protein